MIEVEEQLVAAGHDIAYVDGRDPTWVKLAVTIKGDGAVPRDVQTKLGRVKLGCRSFESVIADDDVITVVGEYNNHYIESGGDWKICKSELVVHWSHGNAELFVVAKERALKQLKG